MLFRSDVSDLPESAQTIADLVLAAIRDASDGAAELQEELQERTMGPLAGLAGGGGLPGIPGLPGLPGAQPGNHPGAGPHPGDDE